MAVFSSSDIIINKAYQGWYENSNNNNTLKLTFTTAIANFIKTVRDLNNISISDIKLNLTFSQSGAEIKKYFKITLGNGVTLNTVNSLGIRTNDIAFNSTTYISLNNYIEEIKTWIRGDSNYHYFTSVDPETSRGTSYSRNFLRVTAASIEITYNILKSTLLSYPSSINLGQNYNFKTSSAEQSHTISLLINGNICATSNSFNENLTYSVPITNLANLFGEREIQKAGTIRLTTYNNSGSPLGYEDYVTTFYLTSLIAAPTLNNPMLSYSSGDYILKNLTTVTFNASGTTQYAATITNYILTFGSITYSSTSGIFNIVPTFSGNISYSIYCTDSRNFQSLNKTGTIYVNDYTKPTLSNLKAFRCNSDGILNDLEGTYIKITASITYTASLKNISGISQSNSSLSVSLKTNSSNFNTPAINTTTKTYSIISKTGFLSLDTSFSDTITITDGIGQFNTYDILVGSVNYLLHFRKGYNSMGIGCAAPSSNNQLNIAWPVLAEGLTIKKTSYYDSSDNLIQNETNDLTFEKPDDSACLYSAHMDIINNDFRIYSREPANNNKPFASLVLGLGDGLLTVTELRLFKVLSPAYGGTGYTSLQATRNAMGLGNTTGALPIENGGTGKTTAAEALKNLGIKYGSLPTFKQDEHVGLIYLVPI